MRRALLAIALSALPAAGCGHCGSSTGWRFEVLSPPVVMSPSLVASGPAPIGTVGFGTIEHRGSQSVQLVQEGACVSQTPIRSMSPVNDDCATLAQACERIRALEALVRQRRPEALPMPNKAPETPKNPGEE